MALAGIALFEDGRSGVTGTRRDKIARGEWDWAMLIPVVGFASVVARLLHRESKSLDFAAAHAQAFAIEAERDRDATIAFGVAAVAGTAAWALAGGASER